MSSAEKSVAKAKTGVWRLDDVLAGGFSRGHLFLVEGAPGTGKTTIALQFLLEGVKAGVHESTIRGNRIDRRGLTIGAPLDNFEGVLRGVPTLVGGAKPLLEGRAS